MLARFIVWEGEAVLQVPSAAVFRTEDGWRAFVVRNGLAVDSPVTIGHLAGLRTQVIAGLNEGDQVVAHPPRTLQNGRRVTTDAD